MPLAKQVFAFLQRYRMVAPGDTVVVAVSGGADSVALLHLLNRLRESCGISLHVAHLNHMFRGAEAGSDADLVVRMASKLGLPVFTEMIDVPEYCLRRGLSPQAGAREVRYEFFSRVATSIGAARVALGHHADDQAETVLLNFIRGSGPGGLGGIRPVRDNFYIRPLLSVRRRAIEDYCHDHRLEYRQDTSNLKFDYTRNRVRLQLLPLLETGYNPAMIDSLVKLGNICREEDSFLEDQARRIYAGLRLPPGEVPVALDREGFLTQPGAMQRRLLRLAWQQIAGTRQDLSYQHVEDMMEIFGAGATGAKVELPGCVKARINYGGIEFYHAGSDTAAPEYSHPLKTPGKTIIPELGLVLEAVVLPAEKIPDPQSLPPEEALLDYDRLPGPLFVRRRAQGDKLRPLGLGGTMKLKKFLINQKIPARQRDLVPLVVSGKEVIWVAGLRLSEDYKVSPATRRCLLLKMRGLAAEEL
ncbi:MAG: tRNA lysidine(34) synthetase TilS [Bacillota bacterium]